MSTLSVPPMLTSPLDDAKHLYKAFKGMGCDTAAVVNILAHRDATQRSLIEKEYKSTYAEDLHKRLASELSGNLERAILMWMPDPAAKDATIIRQSLAGDTISLKTATEIICSRTSSQIQYIKQLYQTMFHAHLEHDIGRQATGDLKELLLGCVTRIRFEGPEVVDRGLAGYDAKALFKAGEKKIGTDETTFIHVFTEKSRAYLMAVASAYHSMYGTSLKKAVKSETSGNFGFGLMTILQCAENPGLYFAKLLHKAMKGIGTDDSTLTRIVVTRTEIDMQHIKMEYHKKYGKTLNDAIHSETSSHYRTFLLSLLGATHR